MTQFQSKFDPLLSAPTGQEFVISGADLWQWWQHARASAIAHQIDPTEADWLLQALTPLDRLALRLGTFRSLDQIAIAVDPDQLIRLWRQRIEQHVPVQYLAGKTVWRDFVLQVTPAVLIPRPETELVIDLAIQAVAESGLAAHTDSCHWADLGAGSGAIAIGLATAFPTATIHAVDVSAAALAIAQTNAATYRLSDRIHFYQGSWFEPCAHLRGQLSGIVSNPPYIPSQEVLQLQTEVTQHEPHLALDGGIDGLDAVRYLIATAPAYLKPGGLWLIEMMAGQAIAIADLLHQNGNYDSIQIHTDLAGVERFALAFRR